MRRSLRRVVVAGGLVLLLAAEAQAEKFLDLYGGVNATDDTKIDVLDKPTNGPGRASSIDVEFDPGTTLGLRVGGWLEAHPWLGFAGDISYFKSEGDFADFSVVPVSLLLMVRQPVMVSREFPHGRLQPYLAAGPSLMNSNFEVDLRSVGGRKIDEGSGDFGYDLRGGLLWLVSPRLGLFVEYRYTQVSVDFDMDSLYFDLPHTNDLEVQTDFITHHVLAGVSFRF